MENYEVVIGLETHVQLKTKSKMFCGCSAKYFGASPNSHTCPVCLGIPGALPVINRQAVEAGVEIGLALNGSIDQRSRFDRKNYFYPDLPKGYQISQYEKPISLGGWLLLGDKKVGITRAHLEEDTGKLIHVMVDGQKISLIDFNRSGVPLVEIVSEPDLSSPQEAKEYAKKLHQIMKYLGVADADMEKAGMRFDGNISLRKKGEKQLGTKVEVKNINSFKFLEKALEFEIKRQIKWLESGEKIVQETRGWVESKGETLSQRSKEVEEDYRYFPEPDLPALKIDQDLIEKVKRELPELPDAKIERLIKEHQLRVEEARLICEDKELAEFFEEAAKVYREKTKEGAKDIVNWLLGEVKRNLNEQKLMIQESKIEPIALVELILLMKEGKINNLVAKEVLKEVFQTGLEPRKIVSEKGLETKGGVDLERVVQEALKENPKAVSDYKSGKEAALGFLLGKVMRKLKGQADPEAAVRLIKEQLQ